MGWLTHHRCAQSKAAGIGQNARAHRHVQGCVQGRRVGGVRGGGRLERASGEVARRSVVACRRCSGPDQRRRGARPGVPSDLHDVARRVVGEEQIVGGVGVARPERPPVSHRAQTRHIPRRDGAGLLVDREEGVVVQPIKHPADPHQVVAREVGRQAGVGIGQVDQRARPRGNVDDGHLRARPVDDEVPLVVHVAGNQPALRPSYPNQCALVSDRPIRSDLQQVRGTTRSDGVDIVVQDVVAHGVVRAGVLRADVGVGIGDGVQDRELP